MSATDDEQQRDEDDERAARERRERREERRRRKERTRREGLRRRLGDSSAFKRETFYALENLNRANWPAKIVGGALFALILLNRSRRLPRGRSASPTRAATCLQPTS